MKIVDAALFAVALVAPALLPTATVSAQASCERMSSISVLNATVTLATSVPAGNVSLSVGGIQRSTCVLPRGCYIEADHRF